MEEKIYTIEDLLIIIKDTLNQLPSVTEFYKIPIPFIIFSSGQRYETKPYFSYSSHEYTCL